MTTKNINPNCASIILTENCNLNCTYCFEKDKSVKMMNKKVAKATIDFLIDNAIKEKKDYIDLMLFGGEPLLNLDVIEFIFEYAFENCFNKNLKISGNIITNGTIYNERVESLLKKFLENTNFSIQISLDGIKKSHDKFRTFKNGEGSFDLIIENLKKFFSLTDRITIHGCLTPETINEHYESFLYFREELNIMDVWFLTIDSEDWTKEHVDIYKKNLEKISKHSIDTSIEKNDFNYVFLETTLSKCFMPSSKKHEKTCSAGVDFIAVTPDGEIFPCHQFYFEKKGRSELLGNVFSGISDIKKKSFYENLDPYCFSCLKENPDCKNFSCYRCIAENFLSSNGDVYQQNTHNKIKCDLSTSEREVSENTRLFLEKLYSELNNGDKKND